MWRAGYRSQIRHNIGSTIRRNSRIADVEDSDPAERRAAALSSPGASAKTNRGARLYRGLRMASLCASSVSLKVCRPAPVATK